MLHRCSTSYLLSEVRNCLKLAVPIAAAQLTESATAFVDTVMMGWLGSDAIAAGGLGAIAFCYLLWISASIVSAISPMVAQAHGAENQQKITQVVQQGLWLCLMLALPIALLLWFGRPILLALGQSPGTVALTQTYLQAIAWGFLPALAFSTLKNFVCSVAEPRPVMVIVVIGTLLNALCNYVLMFGKLGLPALGLAGIGLSSTICLWAMFFALAAYTVLQPSLKRYAIWQKPTLHLGLLQKVVWLGLPIGALMAIEAGIHTIIGFLAGQLGTTALAAHQIVYQTGGVISYQIANGVAIATTVRVGQLMGQGSSSKARNAGQIGIALAAITMGSLGLLFWLIPNQIVGLYLDLNQPGNAEVGQVAASLLGIVAIFQIIDGIQVTAAGALRGLQKTRFPMVVGLLAHWSVSLPIAYFYGMRWGGGIHGLWAGSMVGFALAAFLLTWRFSTGEISPETPPSLAPKTS